MNPNWKYATLADSVSDIIDYRGKTPTKTTFGVPLVTAKIVKNGRIEEATEFIADEEYDSWMRRGLPQVGDVLITTEAPLGEVAQITNAKVALAQRIILLRGKPDKLDNTFLKYALLDDDLQNQLQIRTSGTTVTGIKQSELRKVIVPLPPLPEQRAIASILGSLDEKIELNRRQNATLEAMAQRVFRAWFVDFEPVRAKIAGIAPACLDAETAALFPDEFDGDLPKGWEKGRLDDLLTLAYGSALKAENRKTGEVAVYGSNGQVGWHDQAKVYGPGIVVGRKGNAGTVVWSHGDFFPIDTAFYVVSKHPDTLHFLFQLLRMSDLPSLTADSAVPGLNRNAAHERKIVLPPLTLIRRYDELSAILTGQIENNLHQSRTLASIRDQLLPRLLSGALRVPESFVGTHGNASAVAAQDALPCVPTNAMDADAVLMPGNGNLELGF